MTLTGSAAAGTPAYPADRPNTLAGARNTAAVKGGWISERFSSATDEDWYRVDVAHTTTVTATLGSLPADYSLSVYDAAGRLVRSADRKNLGFERLTWRASAGSYFVRVDAVRGFSATKLYALRIRGLRDGVVLLDQSASRRRTRPRRRSGWSSRPSRGRRGSRRDGSSSGARRRVSAGWDTGTMGSTTGTIRTAVTPAGAGPGPGVHHSTFVTCPGRSTLTLAPAIASPSSRPGAFRSTARTSLIW